MSPRAHVLLEANHRQLTSAPPRAAVLPWAATEAHNFHLPYGTDVWEASGLAEAAVEQAAAAGAPVILLPTIPFGNDEQQLDQACTISIRTATTAAILGDVVRSLKQQGIDRLAILNGHGGNQFQPLVRDLQNEYSSLIVVINFYQLLPELRAELFTQPGDHADEMETSLMLHLHPELVEMHAAGAGKRIPFALKSLSQPGVWTPRPWSRTHPDTGSGDPSGATAAKGAKYFAGLTRAIAEILIELAGATKGELPYV